MPSIVKEARRRGITLTGDVLSELSHRGDWEKILDIASEKGIKGLMTPELLKDIIEKEMKNKEKPEEKVIIIKPDSPAKRERADIRVLSSIQKSEIDPSVRGMHRYFFSRYEKMKKLLEEKKNFRHTISFSVAKMRGRASSDPKVRIIGMVNSISITSRETKIITLEDPEGETLKVTIQNPSRVMAMTNDMEKIMRAREMYRSHILLDMVIGVEGTIRVSRNPRTGEEDAVVFPEKIVLPDFAIQGREDFNKKLDTGLWALFISDIHIGSKTFMRKEWEKFIDWLHGKHITSAWEEEVLSGLKYIVMPGDLVDGIGVFPGQEFELEIDTIYGQYEAFGKELERMPDHLEIIILPGNHDAIRPSEPQPPLPEKFTKFMPDNIVNLSNPSYFSLNGREILAYHGRAFDDLAMKVQGMKHDRPIDMMEIMLHIGHIVPIYGEKTPIAPEPEDHLVIERVPHIFVTGHVHKHDIRYMKGRKGGLMLLNASTWQDQTNFQKSVSLVPDPCKVTLVSLDDLTRFRVRDFAG